MNKIIYLVILLCSVCLAVKGQGATNQAVQANIIYRFTKYIDWPASKKTGDFVIGVINDEPLYGELIALTRNKRVGNQPIVVKNFPADISTFNCHILFVSEDDSRNLRRIAKLTSGKPILLVSENNGLIGKGSCINFIIVGERLKLEFSKNNIENRNMSIASELLNLGTVIE